MIKTPEIKWTEKLRFAAVGLADSWLKTVTFPLPQCTGKSLQCTKELQLSMKDSRNIHTRIYRLKCVPSREPSFVCVVVCWCAWVIKNLWHMTNAATTGLNFLTGFDLLDDWFAITVLHLLDVEQGVRVPVVRRPVVHKDPGTTAATVHHDPIIQSRVEDVSGLHGLSDGEVPGGKDTDTLWGTVFISCISKKPGNGCYIGHKCSQI